jgi:uncharacterized protein (TIGR00369 family)
MKPQPRCADLTPFTLAHADPATGAVKLHFDAQPLFANHFDKVQGGFAVAMIDAVLSVAGWVKTGTWLPTLNLMANFVAPLEVGPITGIGTVTKIGKSIAFLEGRLESPTTTAVTASATCLIPIQ